MAKVHDPNSRPVVEELTPAPDIAAAPAAFVHLPGVVLFESCLRRENLGRYSFLTADPFEVVRLQSVNHGDDPFVRLRELAARYRCETLPELPPFQGGLAGVLSYELGHAWENWPRAEYDEFQFPAMHVGVYDWVIAWDHLQNRAWVISHGFPEMEPARRRDGAAERILGIQRCLAGKSPPTNSPSGERGAVRAPQFPLAQHGKITSNFSRDGYLRAVERVIEYIHAGDVFQANLSQRLLTPQRASAIELYSRLRQLNPATFSGSYSGEDWTVVSASPERFLRLENSEVETRPIKGTRRRQHGPEADLFTRDELRESSKDQAENVMIVDLLRNDLSRVCAPGSIRVPQLCTVESYETVQHLVSEIRGRLEAPHGVWDLFAAAFPGGSITGAPKVRAMEIISELEPTARGPYCGSLFYAGFDGTVDSSILIRSFLCRDGWIQCPVGGGIVAQSDPEAEYEETMHKAEGMLRALT